MVEAQIFMLVRVSIQADSDAVFPRTRRQPKTAWNCQGCEIARSGVNYVNVECNNECR